MKSKDIKTVFWRIWYKLTTDKINEMSWSEVFTLSDIYNKDNERH